MEDVYIILSTNRNIYDFLEQYLVSNFVDISNKISIFLTEGNKQIFRIRCVCFIGNVNLFTMNKLSLYG